MLLLAPANDPSMTPWGLALQMSMAFRMEPVFQQCFPTQMSR